MAEFESLTEEQKKKALELLKKEDKFLPDTEWEERTGGNVFVFENEGDSIMGVLKTIRKGQFDNGVYDIETEEGLQTVFGTTVIDSRLNKEDVGKRIKITFNGWGKTRGGQQFKNFTVLVSKK